MLTVLGFLSLFQMVFLPGYLICRALKLQYSTTTEKLAHCMAFSLMANYVLVWLLTIFRCYTSTTVLALFALEIIAIAYCCATDPPLHLRQSARTEPSGQPNFVGLSFDLLSRYATTYTLLTFAFVWSTAFGGIFSSWDDVVSWNNWATQWSHGKLVFSGIYPQLLPTNWSLSYVAMGTTDVQLFAKALMPLFPCYSLLLCIDQFRKKNDSSWLFAFFVLAGIFLTLFSSMLTAGYGDLAALFFCLVGFQAWQNRDSNGPIRALVLPVLLACGAALAKPTGWYFVGLALILSIKPFWHLSPVRKKIVLSAAVALVGLTFTYYVWQIVFEPKAFEYISYLTRDNHSGRTFIERWMYATSLLCGTPNKMVQPLFYFVWLFAGVGACLKRNRWLALLTAVPMYLVWAIGFSYDERALSVAIPFIAYLAGSGIRCTGEILAHWIPRTQNQQAAAHALAATVAIISLFFAIAAFGDGHSFRSTLFGLGGFLVAPLSKSATIAVVAAVSAALVWLSTREFNLQIPRFLLPLAALIVIVALQSTIMAPAKVLNQQRLAQRRIMMAEMNERLYALAEQGDFSKESICTCYMPMKFIPGLRDYYLQAPIDLTQPITDTVLAELSNKLPGRYLLAPMLSFTAEGETWMTDNHCKPLAEANFYRLIKLPTTMASAKARASEKQVAAGTSTH